ncbi:MAG TPA: glutathione S-transferase family protein [Alphaproteobacteria bacterium]|nr:glutathione S-transferase family protein [Alphaproteobacteria bacterium]
MSYELYCLSGACSMAVHVVLNELGQDVKLHMMDRATNQIKSPEFLKLNPRGQIPVLVEDGKALREGAAQIVYLCDKHPSPLLPKSGWERATALQWLMFANSSLHPAYSRTGWLGKNTPEGDIQKNAITEARKQIQGMWDEVEAHLATQGTTFVAGKDVTAGDIVLTVIANWNPQNYTFGPKTKALFKAVTARPAYQKALAAEDVEYKAAA